jgi:hypothetical protein
MRRVKSLRNTATAATLAALLGTLGCGVDMSTSPA